VDARYTGDNVFEVKTENVTRFSLWLHPRMVDFSRPVVVLLNGVQKAYQVQPMLRDALRSYERRQDWGLIYHCELEIYCPHAKITERGHGSLLTEQGVLPEE
jgi:hypothetical protein